MSDIRN